MSDNHKNENEYRDHIDNIETEDTLNKDTSTAAKDAFAEVKIYNSMDAANEEELDAAAGQKERKGELLEGSEAQDAQIGEAQDVENVDLPGEKADKIEADERAAFEVTEGGCSASSSEEIHNSELLKNDLEDYSNPEKYKYNPYTGERNIYYGPYTNGKKTEKHKKEKKPGKLKKRILTAVICVLAVALVSSSSILVYSAVAGKDDLGNKKETVESGNNSNDNLSQSGGSDKDNSSSGKLKLNTNSAALEQLLGSDASLSDIADNTIKSVVGISNYKNVSNGFQGFFGEGSSGSTSRLYGEGSGVIITEDGYVITNQHVIDGSDALQVTMSTGEVYDAEIVGEDAASDLALLKIKTDTDKKFTPIVIGDSEELSVADYVMVVGNPGGSSLSSSVSFGIVSGKNRPVTISSGYTINMLQTDAAINPGNSGGALVNIKGELVGIPSAKYVATDYENLGFAININEAMPIIKELAEYGYVKSRGTIDIDYQVIDRAMSQYYNLPSGLYVTKVNGTAGSLKSGDIITEVNGNQVYSEAGLTNALAGKSAGDEITIKYYDSKTNQYAETKITLVESKIQSKTSSGDQAGTSGGYSDYYGNR